MLFRRCVLLWPFLLIAQAPPAPNSSVTVTGTRSPMEIDKSPVSTLLVGREELESRNIRQIDQALSLTEGVNAIRAKGPADNDFGLGLRGFAGRGGQSRTLILLDGQPVNNSYIGNVNWSTFSVSEMERVEVARGPFSSLYGGNAMGGVVNMITRPVDKQQFEIFGQIANRDTTNYSLRGADRFFGNLGLSFGYSRFQTGGYPVQEILRPAATATGGIPVTGVRQWLTPTGGTTYQVGWRGNNWFNQEAYRARAEYTFSPKLFASLQYMRQSRADGYDAYTSLLRDGSGRAIDNGTVLFTDRSGLARRLTLAPANFIGTPTGALVNMIQTQVLATLTPDWSLRVAAGFTYSPRDWYVTPGANATLSSGTGSYVSQLNRGFYGNIQISRNSQRHGFIAGTETRQDRARIGSQTIANYAVRQPAGTPYDTQAGGMTVNQAAYLQYQLSPIENLQIVAGGRWDYWKTYDGSTQTAANRPLVAFPERSTNSFTGKIAAVYRLPGDWQVRGSIGNAFRNPSIYELYRDLVLSGVLYLANPNVQPERLLAYEGGVRRQFSNGYSVESTYFVNRVSDLIYRTTDFAADPAGGIRRLTNAGLGRTRGVEVAFRQRARSWLQFRQSYTWADSIITKNPALPATVGKKVPYVPEHTLTFLAIASGRKWNVTWSGRYSSASFSSDTNLDTTRGVPGAYDPFFETDATATYEINRHLSLLFNADNLLDRRYHLSFYTPGRSVFGGFRWRL